MKLVVLLKRKTMVIKRIKLIVAILATPTKQDSALKTTVA